MLRQARLPEGVELQLRPQLGEEPASAPLARALQAQRSEAHLHAEALRMAWHLAVGGKEGELLRAALFSHRIQAAGPALALRVIEFAEVEHMALNDTRARAAHRFDDAPVTMFFAVLDPRVTFEPHDGCRE